MKYQFEITIINEKTTPIILTIERVFEQRFLAQSELTNIGKNGLIYTNEKGEQKYYPPHRILEIDFKEIN